VAAVVEVERDGGPDGDRAGALLGHALGEGDGGDAPGLRAEDAKAVGGPPALPKVLRQLRGLSASRFLRSEDKKTKRRSGNSR
jgi:hypothetical protein